MEGDDRSKELFCFLSEKISSSNSLTNLVIITKVPLAITNVKSNSLDDVSPCSHEEADTRLFVHARDAVLSGSRSPVINPTTLVIAVYILLSIQKLGLQQMLIFFRQGSAKKQIPVHEVVAAIGLQKASGILFSMLLLDAMS